MKSGRVQRGAEDRKVNKRYKVRDKTQGGKSQNQILSDSNDKTKDDWCKEQKGYEKDRITYVDKSTHQCGEVQTKVS